MLSGVSVLILLILVQASLSRLFSKFSWLDGFLRKWYGRKLEVQDIFGICPDDKSEILGDKLQKGWLNEVRRTAGTKQDPSLLRALCRLLGLKYLVFSVFLLIEEGLNIAQPILLGALINYFTPQPSISETEAYLYAMGVSICAILQAILYHPYHFFVSRLGMRIRAACCSLMYRKCLRLSNSGLSKTATGQIVNLMSNDVQRLHTVVINLPFLFVGPLLSVGVIAVYWDKVGKPMLSGVSILILLILVQASLSRLFSKFRLKTARFTDKRVSIMNEIVAGIRIIKMYCWEHSFRDLIADIRRSEIHNVRMTNYLFAIQETLSRYGRYICLYATVLFYVLSNETFRASELYIIVGLLNAISLHALTFLAHAVQHIVRAAVSIKRMETFLELEELPTSAQDDASCLTDNKDSKFIEIERATAKWDETADQPTLSSVSTSVKENELLAVIGPVGSGKSSLLMAILKELPLLSGEIRTNGRLAYVSQQAWVLSASIKENIVLGNEFNEYKYNEIIQACALDKDIALLPYGDSTIIGDRGVKMSGGQRARISLARALYMDGDIYLLDDPFSAVDTNVAGHIFENVIQGILKNKPKLLVTHSLQFLSAADNILVLNEGRVIGISAYDDMCKSGEHLTFLRDDAPLESNESSCKTFTLDSEIQNHTNEGITKEQKDEVDCMEKSGLSTGLKEGSRDKDVEEEESYHTGTVNWKVYLKYLQLGTGAFKGFVLVCLWLATQAVFITSDWWLSQWSNENEAMLAKTGEEMIRNISDKVSITADSSSTNLGIYSGLIAGLLVFGVLRAFLFFHVAVNAAETLHDTMFGSIIRSTIAFFDVNPVGRVLNRFSKDMGQIDEGLPLTLFDFLQCFFIVVGMVCVAGVVNPWVFIAIVPLCVLLVVVRHYYIQTSRQVQRLEGVTRSPAFSHLSATLQGLHTIRAFGSQAKFLKDFDCHQDIHTAARFLFLATGRWFTVRLDLLCALFVTSVSFGSVFAAENAGLVGFSMTYAFAVMGIFQWMVRQSTIVETEMVSVERVLDYCKLPSEAPLETDVKYKPADDWPLSGEIRSSSTNLKYVDHLPHILKDITFTVYGKEKVGIVGRTGAGKSSMIAMLMRLVEYEGTVTIDGVDIKNIGLHDLRNRISVIPQDPVLFTGKLRRNLDPFGEHDERALWHVLEAVEMKQAVENLPHGLDKEVSEGGINFSVGQRQLICLARAILRNNKILIIDEATANVDTRTDHLIQKTIREKFDQCTVLTIAHRLYTVMDSDRVMVLDQGNIKEFDHPFLLMQNEEGFLYQTIKHMHDIHDLLGIAKAAYGRKYASD